MSEDLLRELSEKYARACKRRCWWVDQEDVRQEAARVMLEAFPHWSPAVGVPLEPYLWAALTRAVSRYVLSLSAPVSASKNTARELRGLLRAPLDPGMVCHRPRADELLHKARVERVMREQVSRVIGSVGAEAAIPVLTKEENSRDVASRVGVPVEHVYMLAGRARDAIRVDPVLWNLWKEEIY